MGLLESLDSSITDLFGQWNGYSTALATTLVVLITYRIMSATEPDAHPLLLARQSMPSSVRKEGESAVYRSQSAPHGMALNAGLNVKDPGAPKFSRGRDGDLRDVWRKAVSGDAGARGRLLTVLGSENVIEHKMDDINRQINIIGRYIAEQGSIKVAIYLPNSIEHLITLLACSFYPNLTAVLIPFDVSESELISMLRRSAVDTVVTATGSFPLDAVVNAYPSLRQLIWVVDEGSRHMDWNDVPEGMGSAVNVTTWQDLLNDTPAAAGTELPASEDSTGAPGDIVAFWQAKQGELEEMVRFTQANLASGISGQIAAIPTRERLTQADLFLPAESLSNMHTLTLTLAALYSNSSVAFNSVAGRSPDLVLATQGVAPTVIVASPATLLRTHEESTRRLGGGLAKLSHSLATSTLTQRGVHGGTNFLSAFAAGTRPRIGTAPGKLRLVYVAERVGGDTPLLSTQILSDLRVYTGARIVYALTAARVAGAVAQTALFDYRLTPGIEAHFGVPPSSVEIYLKDTEKHNTTDDIIEGEIVARGPCVSGGEARLGVAGKINDDNTLSYV
ncbi:AMP-binding enzyme [Metarhizium robertsii]|uniref:Acetyl-CoA synthetase-like protein n=2 Tax=Metarhizium robertsii TaxID=568076 RepID=E9FDI1_METRA|nr:acetyl-CoA synthetase-like protein [Metarhizium robertsii ARSEF 23]EFY94204.2 acetyl-CoA synthetase-like protein [Metarhizium robertsii ARSEF 23]EXU97432.1 AMP-binding enzyme [Metarhizium robertsii]